VARTLETPAGQRGSYPLYARLQGGVGGRGPDGALVVAGYVHCAAALQDHRLNGFPGRLLTVWGYPDWQEHPALTMMFGSMLMLNPPEHTRFAGRCRPLSLPGRVAALRPAISRIADELCDQIDGTVDFVERRRCALLSMCHSS
jgi:cytochrome P450